MGSELAGRTSFEIAELEVVQENQTKDAAQANEDSMRLKMLR
jgi:hypothetical protein